MWVLNPKLPTLETLQRRPRTKLRRHVDGSPFEKAQHRKIAWIDVEGQRRWKDCLTEAGEPVDALLEENIGVSEQWFATLLSKFKLAA